MKFRILHKDTQSHARTGIISTDRGHISTPVFMPVGTMGTVKTVHQHELDVPIKAEIILANTYHLYLRPGTKVITKAEGIHRFINWSKPMLTDSGGYQIYSLSKMRKIESGGVTFQSHIDGSRHHFTPKDAILIQRQIGADFMMAFDECTPYPCDYEYAEKSMNLTHQWLDKSIEAFKNTTELYGVGQTIIPIVQGSTYEDLRIKSAEYIAGKNQEINAIGGLSVGEPIEEMYRTVEDVCKILPAEKPRYLMGVGTPENLLQCISMGIDMFDCVLPTRNARHGLLYTSEGSINIRNKKWESNFSPIDPGSDCPTSIKHSKSYLRHLFMAREWLGPQIASIHNLRFFTRLMDQARENIATGHFDAWKKEVLRKVSTRL